MELANVTLVRYGRGMKPAQVLDALDVHPPVCGGGGPCNCAKQRVIGRGSPVHREFVVLCAPRGCTGCEERVHEQRPVRAAQALRGGWHRNGHRGQRGCGWVRQRSSDLGCEPACWTHGKHQGGTPIGRYERASRPFHVAVLVPYEYIPLTVLCGGVAGCRLWLRSWKLVLAPGKAHPSTWLPSRSRCAGLLLCRSQGPRAHCGVPRAVAGCCEWCA